VAAGDEASLRQALELEPANTTVIISLATLLVDQGDGAGRKEALQLLERIPETADVRRLQAQARVGDEAAEGAAAVTAKLDALLELVKADPAPARSTSTCSSSWAPTTPG